MTYRILRVASAWGGRIFQTYYKHDWWPFWFTSLAFKTQPEAEEYIAWRKKNGGKDYEVIL